VKEFKEFFEEQKRFNSKFIDYDNLTKADMVKWTLDLCRALQHEVAELEDELNWKWWKKKKKVVRHCVREEVIDILHFTLSLLTIWFKSADDASGDYKLKLSENYSRQERGYGDMHSDLLNEDVFTPTNLEENCALMSKTMVQNYGGIGEDGDDDDVDSQKHYKNCKIQHIMYAGLNFFDWWQGNVTKYIHRWKTKNGIEDLKKALSYLKHYIHCTENNFDPTKCKTPDQLKKDGYKL